VGQGLLIIEASRSHSDTPHAVGLLWTSDQVVAETSTWQHTTLTRDRNRCPQWKPNLPMPQTARPGDRLKDDILHKHRQMDTYIIKSRL